jgi:aspartate/methionine/tyrosine aminotransferase
MALPPFKLERWFAQYEFSAPHQLCNSDCEALSMSELLAMSDPESLSLWESLSLGYTESQGLPALVSEIAGMYETVAPEEVLCIVPEEGIYITMSTLLQPGDHVVVVAPSYQSLYQLAASAGAELSFWRPTERDGRVWFDPAELRALVRPKTKLVVVNFPHNPTGAQPDAAEQAEIIAACASVGAYLFSDEMYRGLEFADGVEPLPAAVDLYDRAICLSGMSKTYSLPGLRVGWLATHCAEEMRSFQQFKDWTTICGSAPSEVLALMGLRAREKIAARNRDLLRSNVALLRDFFARHSDKFEWSEPGAGSIAFPALVGEGMDGAAALSYCEKLVEEHGVLILPVSPLPFSSLPSLLCPPGLAAAQTDACSRAAIHIPRMAMAMDGMHVIMMVLTVLTNACWS